MGWAFTWLGLMVATVQGVLIHRMVPLFGELNLAITGLVLYAIGALTMTQAPTWWVALAGLSFSMVGGAFANVCMSSLVSQQAGRSERGMVLGVFQSASWLGRSLSPLAAGVLFALSTHHRCTPVRS